ncbi:unnamed protein product [Prunus brigantina]
MEVKGAFALGGEVRRLQIIYFLSHRMGRVDHPHLIRVHHLTRTGVYLRDVKRWLSDLRGKDMPEAFAWSYKRRYKTGYVWQDLLDDDLITPISDNEYVLKGSEIIYSAFDSPPKSYAEKGSCLFKEQPVKDEVQPPTLSKQEAFHLHKHSKNDIDIQTKVSSEISDESPHVGSERPTSTYEFDAMQPQADENHSADTLNPNSNYQQSNNSENSSFYSKYLLKKKNNNKYKDKEMAPSSFSSSPSSSHLSSHQSPAVHGSKSNSKGMFRNLITCGAVDTNDAVLVMLNRASKTTSSDKSTRWSSQDIIKADRICKADHKRRSGSAGVFGTCWNSQGQPQQPQKHTSTATRKSYDGEKGSNKQQKEPEFSSQKVATAAYRPVGGPHCSQCRKQFKPEKLHSHMKSCRGKKALNKTAAASVDKIPQMGSTTSTSEQSSAAYFLDQLNMHSTD